MDKVDSDFIQNTLKNDFDLLHEHIGVDKLLDDYTPEDVSLLTNFLKSKLYKTGELTYGANATTVRTVCFKHYRTLLDDKWHHADDLYAEALRNETLLANKRIANLKKRPKQ